MNTKNGTITSNSSEGRALCLLCVTATDPLSSHLVFCASHKIPKVSFEAFSDIHAACCQAKLFAGAATRSAHSGLSHWLAGMSAMSPVRLVVVDSQEMRRSSKSNRHRPFSFNDAPFAVFSPLPRSGVRPPWNGCDRVMRGQGRQGCPSCADTGIWQNRRHRTAPVRTHRCRGKNDMCSSVNPVQSHRKPFDLDQGVSPPF